MISTLTFLTVALIGYGLVNRHGFGRALALAGSTPAGVALVAGGSPVPTFYAVALAGALVLPIGAIRAFRRSATTPDGGGFLEPAQRWTAPPGTVGLLVLLAWSILVTLTAPFLFPGLTVPLVTGGTRTLQPGLVTSSNIAQTIYLALGIGVVVTIARSRHSTPALIGLASGTTVLLSLWRYAYVQWHVPFPEGVFDNSPTLAFIETAPGGGQRFRGILSEPSAMAGSCLIALAYFVPRSFQLNGRRRFAALAVAAAAAYLGAISTSGTFVAAGVSAVLVSSVAFLYRFLARRSTVRVMVLAGACVAAVAALWVVPVVVAFVQATVSAKVGSASFDERSNADTVAYRLFFQTYGLGVGLGSDRASSFVPSLLATTGLIGAALFAVAVLILLRRGGSGPDRLAAWVLVTFLVAKLIAGPDLSDPTGILWICLGLLSKAASERAGPPPGPAMPQRAALAGPDGPDRAA